MIMECYDCEIDTTTTIGFYTNWDRSIVWCPRCGERCTNQQDSLRDEAIRRAEIQTEIMLGIR